MGYIVDVGDRGLPLRWTFLRNWFPRSRRVTNEVEGRAASGGKSLYPFTQGNVAAEKVGVVSDVGVRYVDHSRCTKGPARFQTTGRYPVLW